MTKDLEQLLELPDYSEHVVVFTGVGISTLSGIPDFRGPGGAFSKQFKGYDVETLLDIRFIKNTRISSMNTPRTLSTTWRRRSRVSFTTSWRQWKNVICWI